jgi:cytoskeleton protein RodZ
MTELDVRAQGVESPQASTGQAPAVPPSPPVAPAADTAASFGPTLAAARRARAMSQSDVAAQLRLHLRQVRAIEAENLDALPEGPFVRGFLRNYARLVGVPAEPLLASLNGRLKPCEPLRTDGPGVASTGPVLRAAREHASRLIVIGGAVAALLIFAVVGWWTMRPVTHPAPAAVAAAPPVPAAAAAPSAEGGAEPAAVEPPAVSQPAAGQPAAAGATSAAPATALRFSFRERSWVQVTQADGTLLTSQNNEAGTQRTVDGTPPYLLVIGNASNVELEFRGQAVDLAAVASRENVARLRLE